MKIYVDLTRKQIAQLVEGRNVEKHAHGTSAAAKDPIMVTVRNTKKRRPSRNIAGGSQPGTY